MPALLEIDSLSKRFGGLRAISELSFAVREHSLTAIIGPNGAGKTTVLNLITGYLQPSGGSIQLDGLTIGGLPPYRICRLGVGRTFQIVRPFPEMTVEDNVVTGALFARRPAPSIVAARQASAAMLELVGLADKRTQLAGTLSIGEKKKLELARALATRPRLLLLDEVMGGLSHHDITEMIEVLRRIHAQGTTLILIEHVLRAVMALAERVIVMNFGQLLFDGTAEAAMADKHVITSYLGRPLEATATAR